MTCISLNINKYRYHINMVRWSKGAPLCSTLFITFLLSTFLFQSRPFTRIDPANEVKPFYFLSGNILSTLCKCYQVRTTPVVSGRSRLYFIKYLPWAMCRVVSTLDYSGLWAGYSLKRSLITLSCYYSHKWDIRTFCI